MALTRDSFEASGGWGGQVAWASLRKLFWTCAVLWAAQSAPAQSTNAAILSWSKTAAPGQTLFMAGQNLGQATVQVTDNSQTVAARVLRQDAQKVLAVVPAALGAGTLWASVGNSGGNGNKVPFNYPEPWWAQPDTINLGGSTRIFGRNFGVAGSRLQIVLSNGVSRSQCSATVLDDDTLSLTLPETDINGAVLTYGTNLLYIKEPKNNDLYGPVTLNIEPPCVFPTYSVNVTNFGAMPNSGAPANKAFIAAFNDIAQHGGGMVVVPAGTFILNETYGDSNSDAVLPSVDNWSGSYILAGAGVGQTILEFKPSVSFPLLYFYGIALFNNSIVSNLTVQVAEGSYTRGERDIFRVAGTNTLISDVAINSDATTNMMTPVWIANDYATLRNLQIYCPLWVAFNGRQIEITNVTHYGAREMTWYDMTGQDVGNVFGSLFLTTGSAEVCLEGCAGVGRWYQNQGHYKRFFVGQLNAGAVRHLYLGHNIATNHVSQPWSNSGECVLLEGADGFYSGPALMSGNLLKLTGNPISNSAAYIYQAREPLTVAIRNGTGFGQIRHGTIDSNLDTITLDSPFSVPPDATSSVVVAYTFEENIIADNSLYSGTIYPEANTGIEIYGESVNNLIRGNQVFGYQNGYSDWVFPDPSQIVYYNEFSSNVISGALRGIATVLANGICFAGQSVGNAYRDNTLTNMNLELPMWYTDHRYEGLSIQALTGVTAPTNTILAPVYEGNTLNGIRAPFGTDSNATWVVVRENSFVNTHERGYITNGSTILESNALNLLPHLQLVRSSATARVGFYSAIAEYGNYLQSSNEIYLWATNGNGSMGFSVANAGGGSVSLVQPCNTKISLAGSNIFWTNLNPNIYPFSVAVSGPSGSNTQQFYLAAGPCETFEEPITISSNNLAGAQASCGFAAASGQYVTHVTGVSNHTGWPTYHTLTAGPIYAGSTTVLKLSAVNEEVALRNASLDGTPGFQNVVFSFVKNMYDQLTAGSSVKVRLLAGTNQYYEFVDYPYYSPYFQLRTLSKVVNGVPVLVAQSIASHSTESEVIFEKSGNSIKLTGWGDAIELSDPSPLAINGWEILLATYPGQDSFLTAYNSWISLDNLQFVKGGSPMYDVNLTAPTGLRIESIP